MITRSCIRKMNKFVSDTMALILKMENRRLPEKIYKIFGKAEEGKINIYIPTMALAEIGYLSEKNGIETNIEEVEVYCQKHKTICISEMTFSTIKSAFRISDIPELHDRLIAGLALDNKLPLLTNDPIITKSKFVETVWE